MDPADGVTLLDDESAALVVPDFRPRDLTKAQNFLTLRTGSSGDGLILLTFADYRSAPKSRSEGVLFSTRKVHASIRCDFARHACGAKI